MTGKSLAVLITDAAGGRDLDNGVRSLDDVIRGDWTMSADGAEDLEYLVAIRNDAILAVRRLRGVDRCDRRTTTTGRTLTLLRFNVAPAPELLHLVGHPTPAGRMRNPVKYLHTARLLGGEVPTETTDAGRRAVIEPFTLTVAGNGTAVVTAPAGTRVTVHSIPAA